MCNNYIFIYSIKLCTICDKEAEDLVSIPANGPVEHVQDTSKSSFQKRPFSKRSLMLGLAYMNFYWIMNFV